MFTLFTTLLVAGSALGVAVPRDVSLDAAATAEAQQFDSTATRALTGTTITTSDGSCLSVDPFSGDFRENLTPVNVVKCDGSKNQTWDVITSGVHNNVPGAALIVSSLTNACLNFDPRRAAGNQVLLFSCGGRADGSGQVTTSQLFPFTTGSNGPQALLPQNGNNQTCLTVTNGLVDQTSCSGAASATGNELFTFGASTGSPALVAVSSSAALTTSAAVVSASDIATCDAVSTVTLTVTAQASGATAVSSSSSNTGSSSSSNTGSSSSSSSSKSSGSSSKSSGSSSKSSGSSSKSSGSSSSSSSSSSNSSGSSSSSTTTSSKSSGGSSSSSSKSSGSSSSSSKSSGNSSKSSGSSSNNNSGSSSSSTTSSVAVAAASATAVLANTGSNSGSGSNDFATSLTLDPSIIQTTDDGQNPPVAGQSAATTSQNNFINFCAGNTITNGLQITSGSCNPIPIGQIPSVANMPSSKFQSPANLDTIAAETTFNVTLQTKGIQLGTFTNAAKTYFANPQTLNSAGEIIGHTHIVIESIPSLTTTQVTNPQDFVFFKGVDDGQDAQGNVAVTVAGGLPAGAYRMCTIVSSSTHQPAIVPIAQHGSLDDCVYFTSSAGGAAAASGAAASADAASVAAASTTAAAGKGKGAATASAAATDSAAAATTDSASAVAASASAAKGNGKGKGAAAASSVAAASTDVASTDAAATAATATAAAKGNGKGKGAAASSSVVAATDAAATSSVAAGKGAGKGAKATDAASSSAAAAATPAVASTDAATDVAASSSAAASASDAAFTPAAATPEAVKGNASPLSGSGSGKSGKSGKGARNMKARLS